MSAVAGGGRREEGEGRRDLDAELAVNGRDARVVEVVRNRVDLV